jgi:DNA-binding transcriptional LysR family regulator
LGLRFLDTSRGDVERLLNDDAIDMALERPLQMPDLIESELLFPAPFKIIIAANNPALRDVKDQDVLPLDIMCSLRWALRAADGTMRGPIDDALEQMGRNRKVVLAMPNFMPLLSCIANSDIAAAVPAQFAWAFATTNNLRVFDLPFDGPVPEIKLYWHTRRTKDPAHTWLRQNVSRMCEPFRVNGKNAREPAA